MDIWIKDSKCYTVAGEIVDVRTLNVTFSTQCQVGDARVLPQGMLAHSTRLPPFRQRWTSERQQIFMLSKGFSSLVFIIYSTANAHSWSKSIASHCQVCKSSCVVDNIQTNRMRGWKKFQLCWMIWNVWLKRSDSNSDLIWWSSPGHWSKS